MATHIKDILNEFLKQKQKRLSQQQEIETIVNKLLTQELKTHIYLKKMIENKIVFSSDSSGATYNLNLIKEKLLSEIQKQFPKVQKITVQTGAR